MRRLAVASASLAVLLSAVLAPVRGQEEASKPPAERRDLISEVRGIVAKEFFDKNAVSRFDAVADRFREDGNPGEESPAVSEALEALNASHTGRYTRDQIEYYDLLDIFGQRGPVHDRAKALFPPDGVVSYPGIGIVPRLIDGKNFIAYVYDGSPADKVGMKVGDEILRVDGKPYEPVRSFEGKIGQKVRVEVRRAEARAPETVAVEVQRIQPAETFRNAIRNSARIIERDGRRYAYLRLWTFASDGVEDLVVELLSTPPLEDADALILDMRSRWGGAPPDAVELFVGPAPNMELIDREGKKRTASFVWGKPIVGIIDGGTRSGMEILAHALKASGMMLVGNKTAGAVLAGRAFVLRDDSLLLLAVLDVRIDGTRLEGAGVTPNIEVSWRVPYTNGHDPQLERALLEVSRAQAEVSTPGEGGAD